MDNVFIYNVPRYTGAAQAVEKIFAASANAKQLTANSHVLIKPNLLAKHVPEAAVTTHPAVLRAVIEALQRRGVHSITVADSAGGLYNTNTMKAIYKASGLAAVCEDTGAALYLACKASPKAVPCGTRVHTFNLIEPLHTADFIINLPKMKTHVMTGLSCATKNLFGCIPGLEKAELHMRFPAKQDFGNMLVDLCETVKPQLHIVDGIMAMEGDGPAGGVPRAAGILAGGENPYTIDLAMCRIMGLAPANVPYLAAAISRGLCAEAIDTALLAGDVEKAEPIKGWLLPRGQADTNFSRNVPPFLRGVVNAGQKAIAPRPKIDRSRCIGCGKCAEICPGKTIMVADKKAHINAQGCIRCFCCHEMCPVKAIEVKRFSMFKL